MRLASLSLKSFRSHADSRFEFAPKINLLHGPNGVGKTNVLEAVHFLCLTKSFLAGSDAYAVQRGARFFDIEGHFVGRYRANSSVRLVYMPTEGKRLFRNGAQLERLAEIVGELPVVTLSPSDHVLTGGGPEHRRRFLDSTLSQAQPVYLDDLLQYRRALKQRNALLHRMRRGSQPAQGALEAWTDKLVQLAARIVDRRRRFLEQYAIFLAEAFRMLNAVGEEPTMEYVTVARIEDASDVESIADIFGEKLAGLVRRELEQGRTLAGPHRDEVVFRLGDFEVRPYASQGQHRTVGLALRLATFLYLQERLDETPMLLLDDVFGTLDSYRSEIVLELLSGDTVGQSFITASRLEALAGHLSFGAGDHQAFALVDDHHAVGPVAGLDTKADILAPVSIPRH